MILHLSSWLKSQKIQRLFEANSFTSPTISYPADSDEKNVVEIPVDIWENWEWLLSQAEELAQLQSSRESQKIKEELNAIKSNSSLRFRTYFSSVASSKIDGLTEEDKKNLSGVLDPSKSSKILSDVINEWKESWLLFLKENLFTEENGTLGYQWNNFKESFYEQPYQRNIVGALKELVIIFFKKKFAKQFLHFLF